MRRVALPKEVRALVTAVTLTALLLFLAAAYAWPHGASTGNSLEGIAGFRFWTTLTLVVSSFPVRTPRGSVVSVSIAPILASALLGGPAIAAAVGFVGSLEVREVRREVPWYGTLYNHCAIVIAAVVAGVTYAWLTGIWTQPGAAATFSAALVAGACYSVVAESLAAVAVAVRQGRSFRAVAASDMRAFGPALLGLVPLAWLMALAYTQVGWLVVMLFALPLYTTRAAYQSVVEIRRMFTQTVRALASAIDARDPSTRLHSENVSRIAMEIGQEMSVSEAAIEQLEWGGLLHDIGKIGVRDAVLLKPDRLNKEERMSMNEHPAKGAEILAGVDKLSPELPLIRHHHEWYNGSGYPDRLIGEAIPFLARILHVADAFEAMTAVRPYRLRPLTSAQALDELRKYAGIQFDPRIVEAFARTQTAQGDRVLDPVPEPLGPPIPMLGQVAARRSKGSAPATAGPSLQAASPLHADRC